MMDGDGRCDGYVAAMTAIEFGGNGSGARTSDGRHRGMLAHYGRASMHLKLSSFGYKYSAAPHCSRDGFTYACPLPTLDVCDLDRVSGHVSKFNGTSYMVRWSLLNPLGRHANDDRRRNCNGDCDNDNIYGKDGGRGATTTKAKEDGKGRSPMRLHTDDITNKIIKALVKSIDKGGHGPVSPLTMMVFDGTQYRRHRLVVLVEHLVVVLQARLRRNDGHRFNDDMSTNGIVRQPVRAGTRHRDMDARHQDEEAFGEDPRQESCKAEKAMTKQMRSADPPLVPKHRPTHRSMARCPGRWHHSRRRRQPGITFSACRQRGGGERWPLHRTRRSPPPSPDRGVTSLPNKDPVAGPLSLISQNGGPLC